MSKILKNTTVSAYDITDCGIQIPASPGQYTIPAQDYWMWAASSDCVTGVGSGDLVVNDGSDDLTISDGVDLVKHINPTQIQILGSDGSTVADVYQSEGNNYVRTQAAVEVSELLGTVVQPYSYFEVTACPENATFNVQIDDDSVDKTTTVTATEADNPVLTAKLIRDDLNGDTNFKAQYKAIVGQNSNMVYVRSISAGGYHERPNADDFKCIVGSGGTRDLGYNNILRRQVPIALYTHPKDPTKATMGVYGEVETYQKCFKDVFVAKGLNGASSDMAIDGSDPSVDFIIEDTETDKDLVIEEIRLVGADGNLVMAKFFDMTALTNGLLLTIQSEGVVTTFPAMKTSEDIVLLFCRGGVNFFGYLNKNGVFIMKPSGSILLKRDGTYGEGNEDFIKFTVQDSLAGLVSLGYSVNGYYVE